MQRIIIAVFNVVFLFQMQRMQQMLEETLTKNMFLQQNMDTMSQVHERNYFINHHLSVRS